MKIKNQVFLAVLMLGSSVFSQGYQVSTLGVKQASLGGVAAFADDASVGFYNPAGLAVIKDKVSISAGVFGAFTQAEYKDIAGVVSKNADAISDVNTPFYFAANYKVIDKVAIGVNVATPFGTRFNWDSKDSKLPNTYSNLRIITVQPSIALKLSEFISIGGGANYYTGDITQKSQNATLFPIGQFSQVKSKEFAISEWGWNAGIFLKPTADLNVSVSYRSFVDVAIKGADFTSNPVGNITSVNTNFPLPAQYSFGVSYQMVPKLLFAGQIDLVEWSKFDKVVISNAATNVPIITQIKKWNDGVVYRVGLEYAATNKVALRAGYSNDKSVVPSSTALSSDFQYLTERHTVTGGLGFKATKNLNVNLYGACLLPSERNTTIANIKLNAYTAGLGIAYSIK